MGSDEHGMGVTAFAEAGKLWPTGELYSSSKWTDGRSIDRELDDTYRQDDDEDTQFVDPDWHPTIERTLDAEEIREALFKAIQIDDKTGLPRHKQTIIPIKNVFVTGRLKIIGVTVPYAFHFEECEFENDVNLKDNELSLIRMRRCRLPSLSLKRSHIDRSVVIERSLIERGLNLRGVKINGLLGLKGTRTSEFVSPNGDAFPALDLQNASVNENIFLRKGFYCDGLANLGGVHIKGTLDCRGSHFAMRYGGVEKRPLVLRAKNAVIDGSVLLVDGFTAEGEVNFRRATIGAQMSVRDASLTQIPIKEQDPSLERPFFALNLEFATITQDLAIFDFQKLKGDIGLQSASAKILTVYPEEWFSRNAPIKSKLWLAGFRYDNTTRTRGRKSRRRDVRLDTHTRLKWLKTVLPKQYRRPGFVAQPWEQMAHVLRENGEYQAADLVIEESERQEFRSILKHSRSTPWRVTSYPIAFLYYWFLRLVRFGYGFGYARIFPLLLVVWIGNVFVYSLVAEAGHMKPLEEEVILEIARYDLEQTPEYYLNFNACIYAADILLPISLGQDDKWVPMQSSERALPIDPAKKDSCTKLVGKLKAFLVERGSLSQRTMAASPPNNRTRHWLWANKLFGWAAFILIGVSFAGHLGRHESNTER